MSTKTIALYQAYLAAQGRAPKKPVDVTGVAPAHTKERTMGEQHERVLATSAPRGPIALTSGAANDTKKVQTVTDIMSMRTEDIWTLAEQSMRAERWATARAALDELGMRLDSAFERIEHRARGGALMPTLDDIQDVSHRLPACYRPLIADRIRWVNGLVEQSARDAEALGL